MGKPVNNPSLAPLLSGMASGAGFGVAFPVATKLMEKIRMNPKSVSGMPISALSMSKLMGMPKTPAISESKLRDMILKKAGFIRKQHIRVKRKYAKSVLDDILGSGEVKGVELRKKGGKFLFFGGGSIPRVIVHFNSIKRDIAFSPKALETTGKYNPTSRESFRDLANDLAEQYYYVYPEKGKRWAYRLAAESVRRSYGEGSIKGMEKYLSNPTLEPTLEPTLKPKRKPNRYAQIMGKVLPKYMRAGLTRAERKQAFRDAAKEAKETFDREKSGKSRVRRNVFGFGGESSRVKAARFSAQASSEKRVKQEDVLRKVGFSPQQTVYVKKQYQSAVPEGERGTVSGAERFGGGLFGSKINLLVKFPGSEGLRPYPAAYFTSMRENPDNPISGTCSNCGVGLSMPNPGEYACPSCEAVLVV